MIQAVYLSTYLSATTCSPTLPPLHLYNLDLLIHLLPTPSIHPSTHYLLTYSTIHSVTYLPTYSLELITHPPNSLTHPSIQNNHPSFQSTQQVTLISPPAPGRQQKAEM